MRIQYCDSKVRTEREFNRSFLIQNIPWDVSLRDLFHQSRTFGLVKDLCITDRSSSEQSERQRRNPSLALLEFQDKWSATKFLNRYKRYPFFDGIEVKPFFFNLKKPPVSRETLETPPVAWKLQLFHQKS